jgi:hypothetical protein
MRTPEGIYFAEGLRFKDINFEDPASLADAMKARFNSYYIETAKQLIKAKKAFAAGLVSISLIDSLSECMMQSDKHDRFILWCEKYIVDLGQDDRLRPGKTLADTFYNFFRHGLVHHSRINCGGQISLDLDGCFVIVNNTYVLNPSQIIYELESILEIYLADLIANEERYEWLKQFLRRIYKADIQNDIDWK